MLRIIPRNNTFLSITTGGCRSVHHYGWQYMVDRSQRLSRSTKLPTNEFATITGPFGRREWTVRRNSPEFIINTDEPVVPPPEPEPPIVVPNPEPTDEVPAWLPPTMWVVLAIGLILAIIGIVYFIRA